MSWVFDDKPLSLNQLPLSFADLLQGCPKLRSLTHGSWATAAHKCCQKITGRLICVRPHKFCLERPVAVQGFPATKHVPWMPELELTTSSVDCRKHVLFLFYPAGASLDKLMRGLLAVRAYEVAAGAVVCVRAQVDCPNDDGVATDAYLVMVSLCSGPKTGKDWGIFLAAFMTPKISSCHSQGHAFRVV